MPSSMRSKDTSGNKSHLQTPMSERQQMALLMQMTSASESLPKSPGGTSYAFSRQRDRNERGETPLHLAAIKGDVDQAVKLLAHRADPNVTDFAGWTPLHEACNYGWFEIANKLVQAGANVNAKGLDNDTPLHDAVINGHLNIIKLLVEHGADIYAKNSKGKSPLDVASLTIKPHVLNPSLPIPESMVPSRLPPRGRDDKKITETGKAKTSATDETMETGKSEDVYEFKPTKEQAEPKASPPSDNDTTREAAAANPPAADESAKRNFAEVAENPEENSNEDESRKKKRKEEGIKEKPVPRGAAQSKGQVGKPNTTGAAKGSSLSINKSAASDKKSPCPSPKVSSDAEDDAKPDPKVPPLKIVIPQTTTNEQETGMNRNSKSSSQRTHQALPYVVPSSNSNEANNEKESTPASNQDENVAKTDEKKDSNTASSATDDQTNVDAETPSTSATTTSSVATVTPASVELHPRKRKMKPSKEAAPAPTDQSDTPAESQVHPHEQPITNCYQLFLDIRKQIEKRRKGLFPVQPKPPQGFKDYLMNRCTYVLAGTTSTSPNISYPPNLSSQMKDIFTEQEKERYRLRMQHVIEKEKLVLSVEQEILRVHGRAARALANQSLPFSVCSILRDEEVYNLITPEQEEKDRNARSRYNGRLFLSWLQDVDDKWEKIKEHMLLRHHNEAESLHAVQKMDWEWKMKELSLCDRKSTPTIDEHHVPMVHVSDDFDLLPA